MLSRASLADQEPRAHRTLPLHIDHPPRLALELVADELVRRFADLDTPRQAIRLHPARGVHGIAPDVEDEFPQTDHSTDAASAVHSDPEVDALLTRRAHLVYI